MNEIPPELAGELETLQKKHAAQPEGRFFVPLANAHRKAGEIDQAITLLEDGLELHPEYLSAYIVLGRCYLDREEPGVAREQFTRVIQKDPHNLVALQFLGEIARREGRTDEARHWYGELVSVDPMNDEARRALALLDDEASDRAESEPARDEPIALDADASIEPDGSEESADAGPVEGLSTTALEQEFNGSLNELDSVLSGEADLDDDSWFGGVEHIDLDRVNPSPGEAAEQEDAGGVGDFEIDETVEAEDEAARAESLGEGRSDLDFDLPGEIDVPEGDGTTTEPEDPAAPADEDDLPGLHHLQELGEFDDLGGLDELDPVDEEPAGHGTWSDDDLPEIEEVDQMPSADDDVETVEEVGGQAPEEPTLPEVAEETGAGFGGPDPAGEEMETSFSTAREGDAYPGAGAEEVDDEADETVVTETMARLYFEQGLYGQAADVYRKLIERRPDDSALREHLQAAERAGAATEDSEEDKVSEDAMDPFDASFAGGFGGTGEEPGAEPASAADEDHLYGPHDEGADEADAAAPVEGLEPIGSEAFTASVAQPEAPSEEESIGAYFDRLLTRAPDPSHAVDRREVDAPSGTPPEEAEADAMPDEDDADFSYEAFFADEEPAPAGESASSTADSAPASADEKPADSGADEETQEDEDDDDLESFQSWLQGLKR